LKQVDDDMWRSAALFYMKTRRSGLTRFSIFGSMRRYTILIILLYPFLSVHPGEPVRDLHDHSRIRSQSIRKLIETEESFDVVSLHYRTLIRLAEDKGDERMQAECLFQAARVLYWQAQYSMSLVETKRALAIAKRLNDKEMLAVGYDLLARLHYLFSPEQAQYYFRKCWQYCEQSDSVELAVSNLNSFNMIRNDREVDLNELLPIDTQPLSPLARAWLGYNIARGMLALGRTAGAAAYLEDTRRYLQQHSGACPLNAMYEFRMGQLKLREGDTEQAWGHVEKSLAIVRKNKILMGIAHNYELSSQIAQAENKESLALDFLKKNVALRDSIFKCSSNLYFPDDLIYTMMDSIAEDRARVLKKNFLVAGILSGVVLAGASLLYYFKSARYQRKNSDALTDMKNHRTNGLHSRMKNHLMKIMYQYKTGVHYCLKQVFEAEDPVLTHYLTEFEENIQKVDRLIDDLLDWVETNPEMTPGKTDFDISGIVRQLVAFYRIGFASEFIAYRLSAHSPVMVRGDRYMLIIALERLFFSLVRNAAKNAVVQISVSGGDGRYAAIRIADPENKDQTLEKDIFAQRIAELETTGKATYTADPDFNIFAECTLRNGAKASVEHTPAKGTVYMYHMPVK
jgi:tetratricopeptide (TPR) repeat protein